MRFTLYIKQSNNGFDGMMFLNDSDRLSDLIADFDKLDAFRYMIDFSDILVNRFNDRSIFDTMRLTEQEASKIITNHILYNQKGIFVKLYQRPEKPKFSIEAKSEGGNDFTSKLLINGQPITKEEYYKLTLNHRQMVFIRGSWIIADGEIVKKFSDKRVNLADIINSDLEISNNESISETNIVHCEYFKSHQISAINKMLNCFKSGRNILLADDMGLGKTASVIGVLGSYLTDNSNPTLVIVPKSLLNNWHSEISKFSDIKSETLESQNPTKGKIYVCTYGHILHRYESVKDIEWSCVIIDEAQQIKNCDTKISKMIKSLKSKHRIAMTGTPIENSANDLWSIFQFVNGNLLGSMESFRNIVCDQTKLNRFIELMSPYVIRRLKSEIPNLNLPMKEEIKIDVELEESEKRLYNSIIDDYEREKIRNKATILSYLTSLKQACGMPSNLFDVSIVPSKLKNLEKLIESSNYERFVVFTQFVKTANTINDYLAKVYKSKGVMINGSLTAKERMKIVDDFQNGNYPYIVMTLKSGNCGLTLTKAHNLVHYDRWWNPAVENQATDRVYRIGQSENVKVYKLIAKGTIESTIDKILGEKSCLFDSVINAFVDNREKIERI